MEGHQGPGDRSKGDDDRKMNGPATWNIPDLENLFRGGDLDPKIMRNHGSFFIDRPSK